MSKAIYSNEQLVIWIRTGADVSENMLQLWQQNQGYIAAIARYFRGYEEEEDLKQQGYLGLCHAVSNYNPDEGIPFINYAGFWIRQSMQRYIEECGGIVRLPNNLRTKIGKYKKLTAAFQSRYNRKPTDRESCYYLGIGYEKLKKLKQAILIDNIGSLDVPIGEDDAGSLYDTLPGQENPEEDVVKRIQQERLRDMLWGLVDELPGQQPKVLRMRYQEELTLQEAGIRIGCNANQTRAIQSKALRALRDPRRARILQLFMYGDIYSKAIRGSGTERFNRTWTSSTERLALIMAEAEEETNHEWEKLRSGSSQSV